jgi:hypothetical protein
MANSKPAGGGGYGGGGYNSGCKWMCFVGGQRSLQTVVVRVVMAVARAATVEDKVATAAVARAATVEDKVATVEDRVVTVEDRVVTVEDRVVTVAVKAATLAAKVVTVARAAVTTRTRLAATTKAVVATAVNRVSRSLCRSTWLLTFEAVKAVTAVNTRSPTTTKFRYFFKLSLNQNESQV